MCPPQRITSFPTAGRDASCIAPGAQARSSVSLAAHWLQAMTRAALNTTGDCWPRHRRAAPIQRISHVPPGRTLVRSSHRRRPGGHLGAPITTLADAELVLQNDQASPGAASVGARCAKQQLTRSEVQRWPDGFVDSNELHHALLARFSPGPCRGQIAVALLPSALRPPLLDELSQRGADQVRSGTAAQTPCLVAAASCSHRDLRSRPPTPRLMARTAMRAA